MGGQHAADEIEAATAEFLAVSARFKEAQEEAGAGIEEALRRMKRGEIPDQELVTKLQEAKRRMEELQPDLDRAREAMVESVKRGTRGGGR